MAPRTVPPSKPRPGSRSASPVERQKAPAGREATSETGRRKTTRLEARITDAQKTLLQRAAEVRGQTLTEFVVRAGEEAATRVLERAGMLVLSAQDSAVFVDALLDPPAPNARLRAAAERYRVRHGAERGRRDNASGE